MGTQETTRIIVDATDPFDPKVQELLKHYRQEGRDAITATGVYVLDNNDQERIAVELRIAADIESVNQKIREEGLTILKNTTNISKISSW